MSIKTTPKMKSLLTATAALLLNATTNAAFQHTQRISNQHLINSKRIHKPSSSPLLHLRSTINKEVDTTTTSTKAVLNVSPGSNVKYPTVRGSEVDSRKIVSEQPLLALRVGHVLFAGEELARQVCVYVLL